MGSYINIFAASELVTFLHPVEWAMYIIFRPLTFLIVVTSLIPSPSSVVTMNRSLLLFSRLEGSVSSSAPLSSLSVFSGLVTLEGSISSCIPSSLLSLKGSSGSLTFKGSVSSSTASSGSSPLKPKIFISHYEYHVA